MLTFERISNSFTLMPIKSSSLWDFTQAGSSDVHILMLLSQPRTESQQKLTATGGCILSLQIMHSNQFRISVTIPFCTALCCNVFWQFLKVASVTAMFTTSDILHYYLQKTISHDIKYSLKWPSF